MKIALYPGSFDPFTMGHLDIVFRGARVFNRVVVGVLNNSAKTALFSPEERVEQIRESLRLAKIENAEVLSFSGLQVELARSLGASALLRGVRNSTDLDYENQIAAVNRRLAPEIETVLMLATPELAYISSSIVKEMLQYGRSIDGLVPDPILKKIAER